MRIGTVGRALPGVEVALSDAGEVLMRGPVVMRGYRNRPDATAEALDADGWMHSGDIGAFDDDGYLWIVDRIKELIINAAGKNMSPANIEATIKSAGSAIGCVCAIGDARPYNVALVTLDPEAAATVGDPRGRSRCADRPRQREARARRADQAVRPASGRLGARRRRADADDEAQAQADRGEVRGRDRGALRLSVEIDAAVLAHQHGGTEDGGEGQRAGQLDRALADLASEQLLRALHPVGDRVLVHV